MDSNNHFGEISRSKLVNGQPGHPLGLVFEGLTDHEARWL